MKEYPEGYECEGQLDIFDILSAKRGKDITRDEYKRSVYPPNTFFSIVLLEQTIGNKICWTSVENKNGFTLEFIDREHAEHFLQEHPEAVGSHDYEIRPRTYTAQQIDDDQQSYGKRGNEWGGFAYSFK
jgi:hypothetical protein